MQDKCKSLKCRGGTIRSICCNLSEVNPGNKWRAPVIRQYLVLRVAALLMHHDFGHTLTEETFPV